MIREVALFTTSDGAVLYDQSRMGENPKLTWLDPEHWRSTGSMQKLNVAGRGSVYKVHTQAGDAILRHYHRGGFMARVNHDRYWWMGASRTRGFHEFHMLNAALEQELLVPTPVAARYVRHGLFYRADIMLLAITHAQTLTEKLEQAHNNISWEKVGEAIGQFHAKGFFHADLNAHNIMLKGSDVYIIDLDRAQRRKPNASWQQANLARLHRSLHKVGVLDYFPGFDREEWVSLVCAHTRLIDEHL
jgi:3-deoxy-D-manno-octulosonic acid kinase